MDDKPIRAWTYTNGYPSTLTLSTTTLPPQKKGIDASSSSSSSSTTHILVKIHAAALNPVDIQLMNLPHWNIPGPLRREKTTGMDFSGVVVVGASDGKGKGRFEKGDEVFGMAFAPYTPAGGALSEYAWFPLKTTVVAKKPSTWTHSQAAAISLVWLTARACIEAIAPWVDSSASKRVAVLGGSSATGIYTVLLAKRRGWKVVASSSGRNREFLVEGLGVDAHVDYGDGDVREGVERFEPVAVVDCVGGTSCVGLPSSRRYVSIVGDKTGRTVLGGPATYYDIFHPGYAVAQWVRWAKGWVGLGERYDVIILERREEWLVEATEVLGSEDVFVDSVWGFEEADRAFERLATGRARGKVVVKVSE